MTGNDLELPRLVVTEPAEHRGLVLLLAEAELIVGHSDTADLVLDDRYVSRRHALISVAASGSVTVRDLNSTGGTFVNEERVTGSRALRAGDLVRFAEIVARFEPAPTRRDQATVVMPVPKPEPERGAGSGGRPPETPRGAGSGGRPPETPRGAGSGGRPPETPRGAEGDGRFVVEGAVTWPDGRPVVGIVVRAVDKDLRTEQPLGPYAPAFRQETVTDARGRYVVPYTSQQFAGAEDDTADLIVRALGPGGEVVAASPVMFNAPPQAIINLQITGAVPGQPCEYDRVVARVMPLLGDLDPPSLLSLRPDDQPFLTGETGFNQNLISALLSAVSLARSTVKSVTAVAEPGIPIPAFYGLIREGTQPTWAALLLLGAPAARLTAAANGGIIPADLGARAEWL